MLFVVVCRSHIYIGNSPKKRHLGITNRVNVEIMHKNYDKVISSSTDFDEINFYGNFFYNENRPQKALKNNYRLEEEIMPKNGREDDPVCFAERILGVICFSKQQKGLESRRGEAREGSHLLSYCAVWAWSFFPIFLFRIIMLKNILDHNMSGIHWIFSSVHCILHIGLE